MCVEREMQEQCQSFRTMLRALPYASESARVRIRYLHLWKRRRRAQGHACTCAGVRGRHVMTCRARVVGSGKGACGTIMEGEEEIAVPWRSNAGYIGCSWFCSWRSNAA